MDELNRKLAEWAGFRPITLEGWDGHYKAPLGIRVAWTVWKPNFTESLDVCFKWLVPKLKTVLIQSEFIEEEYWAVVYVGIREYDAGAETPALALCKAIEKLIDND